MASPLRLSPARRPRLVAGTATLAGVLLLAACAGTVDTGGGTGSAVSLNRLTIMAPADPGGGWDGTARAMAATIESAGLAKRVTVTNVPGAGGTIGLAQLANEKSESYLMVMGLVMIGAIVTSGSPTTLADVTPIAQLTAENEVIVVPADSPYRTVADLAADLKARGRKVAIAGGSAGGTDQMVAGLFAKAAGVSPTNLNYVAFSGGGESLAALLGNKVAAGISSISEYAAQIEAGKLRALAVAGPTRVQGVDAPTLTESGYDVVLTNWRGVVAPKGISAAARSRLTKLVTAMREAPQWRKALRTNGWTDTFQAGSAFESFIRSEEQTTTTVLQELGLATSS